MVARDGQDLQTKSTSDTTGQEAHQKWMHDIFGNSHIEQGRTTDQTRPTAGADQVVQIKPMQLVQEAQSAGKEIASYISSGYNASDKIQYRDKNGQIVETTVGQRINDLKTLINTDSQNAIVAADQLAKQGTDLPARLQNNLNQLDTAAQAVGLSARDPNFQQQLAQAMQNPGSAEQLQALQQVKDLADKRAQLQAERFAPSSTRLSYALLKADGFTDDPATSMDAIRKTGMPKATKQELTDAFMMLQTAGRTDTEVFNSPMYAQVSAQVNGQYAQTQADRGQRIVNELTKAAELSRSGDVKGAEDNYKQAMQDAQGVDQKWLAAQLRIPANAQNPEIAQALVGILTDVKEAKTQYATFLNGQSRYSEALPLLLQVQADTPELAQQDTSFNKTLNTATFGNTMSVGDLQAHQQKFAQYMQDHKWNEASQELDALTKNYQQTKEALDKNSTALGATKDGVNQELTALEQKKSTMDETEYKIEQTRLQNELKVIDANTQAGAGLDKQANYLTYLKGVLAYSKDDKDTAHALFEQVKGDKDIAGNKALNLTELLDATKHQNWFQRNWHAIATGLAVVAGVAVGIAVGCLTGPGGIAAGIGTTGAIMAAVGGGAVAGGLAYTGTKAAIMGKDSVGWGDFKDGAITGGLSAVTTVAGPLLGGARTAAVGVEAAGAGAESSVASNLFAQTVGKLGVTGRGALTGASLAVGKEGYQVAFQGKSWEDAGKSLLWEAPLFATGGGMAASRGLTFSSLGINSTTLKIGAGIAGAKEGAEMAFDGKSFKDAAGSFILEAPMFAASTGMAANASTKVLGTGALTAENLTPTLVASSKVAVGLGGLMPAMEMGKDAYNSYSPVSVPIFGRPDHIALNPNDDKQNQEIWMRYGQLNPNLYHAPDAGAVQPQADGTAPQRQGQDQTAKPVTPYKRMTQAEIQAQSGNAIQDEPLP